HASAFQRGEGAQADAIGQMALQLGHSAVLEPLTGKKQVYSERTPQSPDHHEELGEVRIRSEQFAELVDDDEQRGECVQGRSCKTCLLMFEQRAVVAGGPQVLLPAVQLTSESILHARDQSRLVG